MTPTRILVVEDEAIIATDIERQLVRFGYDVATASTGATAIALAETLQPHLVLMDIHLAGAIDGIDAATAIRQRFSIPAVFLTAYATGDVVERAKQAAPLGYLIKPFDQQSLRTTLEIALHRHHLDAELRRSEARYRAVVESARDAIVTVDCEGRIVGWSRSAVDLFGFAEHEIIGQPVTRLMPASYRESHAAGLGHLALAGDSATIGQIRRVVGQHRDGSEFPIELSLANWSTSDGWFVTAMIRNMSEREKAEASLQLQSAALNAAANAILITDREGTIEWINPAFTALTGYTSDDAIGRNPRELMKSGAHDEAFYLKMWRTLIAGDVWQGLVTNRRKDGTLYVETQTITPVRSVDRTITHFIGVKRDLTEEQRLRAQFLQSQKMEVVGQLAGGVAHDFNNLLNIINGRCELALLGLAPDAPLRSEFGEILDAGERAARLTSQLLTFSRKQVVRPVVFSVSELVANDAQMLRRLIGADISLVITPPAAPALDHIRADRTQIEQVLLNLVVNARSAMPNGGQLTIGIATVALDTAFALNHSAIAPGPYVRLSVADTGVGMTDEVLTRAFEPFFTTREHGLGTGLGLATVHAVVMQNGGCVTIESALGQGTSFHVFLPRAAAERASSPEKSRTAARGTETILVAEDEPALRKLVAVMLRSAGYTVISAEDGPAALAALTSGEAHIDLLFTDVIMPGMSGPALAATVAATHPDLPVLFTSGYTDDKLTLGPDADADRFVPKPYSSAQITHAIRRLLDTRRATSA